VDRRHLIPSALLGILTVLTALAAIWAVTSPPISATHTVQSATTATFGSPPGSNAFSMDVTSSVSSGHGAGVISQVQLFRYTLPGRMSVYRTSPSVALVGRESPVDIRADFAYYLAIVSGPSTWTGHGSLFHRTEALTAFLARVKPTKSATGPSVQGKVHETAVVRSGFLVDLEFSLVVPDQTLDGGRLSAGSLQQELYHLLRINGSPAPTANS
jgi:hypothetical protein